VQYQNIITIEPGKRGGKPCIRGMRITVYDVLSYLASGMTYEELLDDYVAAIAVAINCDRINVFEV
jgi:uncharacterized protein (DUF433 family)